MANKGEGKGGKEIKKEKSSGWEERIERIGKRVTRKSTRKK